jgi:hypothetical protein
VVCLLSEYSTTEFSIFNTKCNLACVLFINNISLMPYLPRFNLQRMHLFRDAIVANIRQVDDVIEFYRRTRSDDIELLAKLNHVKHVYRCTLIYLQIESVGMCTNLHLAPAMTIL